MMMVCVAIDTFCIVCGSPLPRPPWHWCFTVGTSHKDTLIHRPHRGTRVCALCVHSHAAVPPGHVLMHPLLAHLLGYAPLAPLAFSAAARGALEPEPVVGVRCRVLMDRAGQPAAEVGEEVARQHLEAWLVSQAVVLTGGEGGAAPGGSGTSTSSNQSNVRMLCWCWLCAGYVQSDVVRCVVVCVGMCLMAGMETVWAAGRVDVDGAAGPSQHCAAGRGLAAGGALDRAGPADGARMSDTGAGRFPGACAHRHVFWGFCRW